MSNRIFLISFFVFLNVLLGRLFQNTIGSLCFIELVIFAITNFVFWNFTANTIKSWNLKWNIFKDFKLIFIHAGLGLSTSIINILIGQGLISIYGIFIYEGYTSFNYNFINASHTNHIAVNLMCYFALVFYYLYAHQNIIGDEYQLKTNSGENSKVSVSRGNTKFMLSLEKIIYVESSNNCIVLNTAKGKFIKYQSLKSFQDSLPLNQFVRTHRSFLVNMNYVDGITKNRSGDGILYLNTGEELRFSRTYRNSIPK